MKSKFETVFLEKENYPALLKEISNPPRSIHVLGRLPNEEKIKIAVVGTRKATSQGRALAQEVARRLAELGAVVVSGLAMGIDTASHEGALSGGGETLAVLGCGIDIVYPAQNANLAKRIIDGNGAVISEYGPDSPVYKNNFLERNRIIAGLSLATIVIEAPINSGALVTARLAAEAGRDVFVFPGSHGHPNYAGSHKLIRDGARLVSSFEDVLEDLSGIINFQFLSLRETSRREAIFNKGKDFKFDLERIKDENQLLIAEAIRASGEPASIDKISALTKLEPQIVNQNIALLLMDGIIKESGGKYSI